MTDAGERQIVCSGCLQILPEPGIHILPYFNAFIGAFVTTYRCDGCWPASLAETRDRLAATDDAAQITSAAMVFQGHGVFIHEFRRGDAAEPTLRQDQRWRRLEAIAG